MIRRHSSSLLLSRSCLSSLSSSSILSRNTKQRFVLATASATSSLRSYCNNTQQFFAKKNSTKGESEEETIITEEVTSTTTTTAKSSSSKKAASSSKKSSSKKEEENTSEAAASTEAEAETKATEKKTDEQEGNTTTTTSDSSEVTTTQEYAAPIVGTVEDYSRVARANENRLNVIEAEIWQEESCYHPILARGQQNVYEHTDDIPKDVKPMFGDTQIWQTREYFEYRRKAESTRYKIMYLGSGLMVFLGVAGAVAFTRIWIDQPNEVATIRRDLLSHSYGRVLELAAGQGINIGIYPYAVTDVVLMDSNPQELHILRSRLPRTAYPSYQVVCDKAEELASFPDNCFDTVVDMFGLCHYKDPVKVLKQMQRVCKPTGTLLMLEHGKTKYATVNWFLDWYADSHYEKTNGCQWNKDLKGIFKEAGLVVRNLDTQHYGTTHIVVAHPEVSADAPLMAGGQPAPAIMDTTS